MKNVRWLIALLAVALAAGAAFAPMKVTTKAKAPSVIGTWTGDYRFVDPTGYYDCKMELRINSQNGALFRGVNVWETLGAGKKAVKVPSGKIPFVGVLGPGGKTVDIAMENSVFRGTCDGKTMRLTLTRTDKYNVAFNVVLKRK